MIAALGWGALAASSLVIGAWLGIFRAWPQRWIGAVLAFGAGALISAVSFDLAEQGAALGGAHAVAAGLALGAITYFLANRYVEGLGKSRDSGSDSAAGSGASLALGALLDGIPEQAVLGIGLAIGDSVSVGLLAAIFVSNLPEAIGSSTQMLAAGRRAGWIRRLWLLIAAVCTLATVGGYALAGVASPGFQAGIDGFAAGALLVMLIDAMIPEATRKTGNAAGLITVLGFAVAAALSTVS
ncbi:ZIP family zinc transporter [Jatrophihabitans sp. GAS493]|uniref:ZIP family metal transporter n=1 Tax=Jatrophihabitans sp. GAS493 TaxID=1907575 RepID=UPI000BB80BCC|nr:hypothetical protein [Jatrophihabitans sp. GAS493]SOD71016.1 ZIP family zinc transporter [Jatrophihabitans sp. GAS493]